MPVFIADMFPSFVLLLVLIVFCMIIDALNKRQSVGTSFRTQFIAVAHSYVPLLPVPLFIFLFVAAAISGQRFMMFMLIGFFLLWSFVANRKHWI